MGEAKRRKLHETLAGSLMRQGLLMEVGWQVMREHYLPAEMTAEEFQRYRDTFYAGAQHLFFSLTAGIDVGNDITRDDMRKMQQINSELTSFTEDFTRRHPDGIERFTEMRGERH